MFRGEAKRKKTPFLWPLMAIETCGKGLLKPWHGVVFEILRQPQMLHGRLQNQGNHQAKQAGRSQNWFTNKPPLFHGD